MKKFSLLIATITALSFSLSAGADSQNKDAAEAKEKIMEQQRELKKKKEEQKKDRGKHLEEMEQEDRNHWDELERWRKARNP